MGYRNYLSKVRKEVYLEVKDLTIDELTEKYGKGDDDDRYFTPRELPTFKELHELGKYCDFPIDDLKSEFFTKFSDSDCEFSVATKELFLAIIEDYRLNTLNWYTSQLDEPYEKLIENNKRMISEWGGDGLKMTPYDLSNNSDNIVSSWKYEYAVFELVRLFKSFDWENDVLIYNGY